MDKNSSYTWKYLFRARQWCRGLIDRKIDNGENTDVWFDPWFNGYWWIICACF